MADTVDTLIQLQGKRRVRMRFTNLSDGTGEAAVAKVIRANFTNLVGSIPGKLLIEKVQSSIQGFAGVRINWDHTTPDEAIFLGAGWVEKEFEPALADPGSAGGTGNITFTTQGPAANATYDITLWLLQGN